MSAVLAVLPSVTGHGKNTSARPSLLLLRVFFAQGKPRRGIGRCQRRAFPLIVPNASCQIQGLESRSNENWDKLVEGAGVCSQRVISSNHGSGHTLILLHDRKARSRLWSAPASAMCRKNCGQSRNIRQCILFLPTQFDNCLYGTMRICIHLAKQGRLAQGINLFKSSRLWPVVPNFSKPSPPTSMSWQMRDQSGRASGKRIREAT